jgi:hypothetical protein
VLTRKVKYLAVWVERDFGLQMRQPASLAARSEWLAPSLLRRLFKVVTPVRQ